MPIKNRIEVAASAWKRAANAEREVGLADAKRAIWLNPDNNTTAYYCVDYEDRLCVGWLNGDGDGEEATVPLSAPRFFIDVDANWSKRELELKGKFKLRGPSAEDIAWLVTGKM